VEEIMESSQQNRLNNGNVLIADINDGGIFSAALKQVKGATARQYSVV
jgi:hypothetical protein